MHEDGLLLKCCIYFPKIKKERVKERIETNKSA